MPCSYSLYSRFPEPVYKWSGSLFSTYILFNLRVILLRSWMQILNKKLTHNCQNMQGYIQNSIESRWAKSAWNCLPWIFQAKWLLWPHDDTNLSLCHNCHSLRRGVAIWQHVGRFNPQTSRVGQWATWAVVLEVCWYWSKGCSIRWVLYWDEKYGLHPYLRGHHSHKSTELEVDSTSLQVYHGIF